MKVGIASDVHIEFGQLDLKNPGDVDLLILAGDVCISSHLGPNDPVLVGTKSERFHQFFQQVNREFKDVIYIAGNHEHYHGDFKYTMKNLKHHLEYLPNIHILDNQTYHIGDICFIGGTLWTNMNNEDPVTMESIKYMMNDFNIIKNSNRMVTDKYDPDVGYVAYLIPDKFKPEDVVAEHKKMLAFIDTIYRNYPETKKDDKFVIVGHHAPTALSANPKYIHEREMNGGYFSDISKFILDRPKITHFIHGHTHTKFDYLVGTTRVICNPRGYINYEDFAVNFELQVIDI